MTYQLELPLPPTVNHYYGTHGKARYIKPEGKAFREQVAWIVKQSRVPKLTGRLALFIRIHPRDRRTQDIDNRIKALGDALMHAGCFDDDSQIDDLHVVRGPIFSGGKCEVLIGEINA